MMWHQKRHRHDADQLQVTFVMSTASSQALGMGSAFLCAPLSSLRDCATEGTGSASHLEVALDQMSSDSRRETPCSSTVMRRAALSSSRADAPPNLCRTCVCELHPHIQKVLVVTVRVMLYTVIM